MSRTWLNKDDELFKKVTEIVNRYDPFSLIITYSGDEYYPVIIDILNKCSLESNYKKFEEDVLKIFAYWFDRESYLRRDKGLAAINETYLLLKESRINGNLKGWLNELNNLFLMVK